MGLFDIGSGTNIQGRPKNCTLSVYHTRATVWVTVEWFYKTCTLFMRIKTI